MNDSVEKLASLSEQERLDLLAWYKTTTDSEEALDELTQTPTRSGIRKWTDNEQLVLAVDTLLLSIMGKDSPYQFANFRQLYNAYAKLHDQYAPYSQRLGAQYFQFFVRKWTIKNGLNQIWEEKNQTRRNKINIKFPNGYIKTGVAGWGKKKLTTTTDGVFVFCMIPLETVWNSAAYYAKQPAHADTK
jgi:hypothetical protein